MNKRVLIYKMLFVLAVITGITVSSLGQPYEPTVFAFHKIISVGAIVLAVILIRRQMKEAGAAPAVRASIIVLSISAVVLLATGALMSVGIKNNIIRAAHACAPLPAAAAVVSVNISFWRKRQEKAAVPEK